MMKKRQIPLHHFVDILLSLASQHDASPEANDYQQNPSQRPRTYSAVFKCTIGKNYV